MKPEELLRQVQEMADPASAQEFADDVERLRAIVDHIDGNLLDDEPETTNGTNCQDDCHD